MLNPKLYEYRGEKMDKLMLCHHQLRMTNDKQVKRTGATKKLK